MKKEIFKYEGKTVWLYEYLYMDDEAYNRGYKSLNGSFVGTDEAWKEFVHDMQEGFGFGCWDVKRKHADKGQYEDMLYWMY